jgi:two-component system phosphate regulon sensor histidine kinase PhoR
MTEIEQLLAENETLRRQLQSSQDQSRVYLQNVAHQLTAPLGAIKWSIEALRDEKVPLVRKGNLLSSVYSQATILVHLIKNFALMSNLDADQELGQMRNQIQVDVTRLAINLANDFQPQAREVEKSVDVDDPSFLRVLGVHSVFGEKNLIAQAISNLLENAVKYGDPRSGILVHAKKIEGCALCVTSTGIPVTDSEKDKIFDRGIRGTAAKQRVPAGTGIGLYLAKRVMELHQGRVAVQTNGRESTFMLIFPTARLKK